MLLNLAVNTAFIGLITTHLIFDTSGGFGGYTLEMWTLAFSLVGVPVIIMAYHGVLYRNEAQVRGYFFYMATCFSIVVGLTVWDLVFTPACENLPSFMKQAGSAWACGVSRYIHILLTITILSILGYFTHVVNSLCEDLNYNCGPELKDLVLNKEAYMSRYQPANAYCSIEEKESFRNTKWAWESAIARSASDSANELRGMGVTAGHRLFGGAYHELEYPPLCGRVGQMDQQQV